ncbi:MAG: IclR family transcriptional regulator [Microbacterium sp.]
MESQPGVQSVERAFALLEALASEQGEAGLASLAEQTGLAVPTAHRLLRTMQNLGYVTQSDQRRYALGAGLIGLGRHAAPPVAEKAGPLLQHLEELFHETANLAVMDGDLVLYVGQVASRNRMRMFTEVGRRVLPHASGVGKAMLATMHETRVREIVERTGLPTFTPSTLDTEDALVADLRRSRRRGFAIDDGEQEVGVRCIAMAIPGASPVAALSISGPAARITDAIVPAVVDALRDAAAALQV